MGRDRRHWLPTLLVLALLGCALAAYHYDWGPRYLGWYGDDPTRDPAAVAPPAGLEFPEWQEPAPVADPVTPLGGVDTAAVEAALAKGLRDKTLGKHVVAAVGDLGGDGPVWTHDDDQFLPASITKLLTSTAALAALGPDTRFTTRVVAGATPREVVLVGGGDPYLSSKPLTPEEAATTYPERADVVTLARATADALADRLRVRVVYDDSLFSGPTNNPKWRADYVPDDIVTPITALWVDRGASPTGYGKTDDPSLTAAVTFAGALAQAGVKVVGEPTRGVAPPGATELASVQSAPVSQLVERLLDVSDNETAEVLAHHVGLAVSGDGSFVGGAAGVLSTLQSLGVETGNDVVYDGSGLSRFNRLSPATMLQVLQVASRAEQPALRTLITGLPVAGFTGSLADRFASADAVALGDVRAKTGTLSGVSSLAGLVTGRDGTQMVFVLAVDKTGQAREVDVEAALDNLAADLAGCRCGSG
ncbi:MAG: D-alanyl-D-alanine carboxypeptidase/D-alanyl-D-alanine-endopeptidase [Nocardioides sp.]|uniref:D-alanyl-D-alanine carboxypeptidase/D-alanyl-D-alanine endopeptidase n=1 Tax=Nocardioides sp. TaxID=35761 RepID=UPI0032648191